MKQITTIHPPKSAVKQFKNIVNWHMEHKIENRKRISRKIASLKG